MRTKCPSISEHAQLSPLPLGMVPLAPPADDTHGFSDGEPPPYTDADAPPADEYESGCYLGEEV